MTALIPHESFTDTTATSADGHHTVFSPRNQASFLESLQLFGNVRLACRGACVSAQTVYRARRASPGFARAWDAALVAARAYAEATLADRAINGVEEAVYYHGEEVARRRRFDSRLLLAHLARLDRLEDREDITATLPLLDDQIDALRRGEALPDDLPQDRVPPVPSCSASGGGSNRAGHAGGGAERAQDEGGRVSAPAELDPDDPWHIDNRLQRMEEARPANAPSPHLQGKGPNDRANDREEVELLQLEAYEADGHEWWLVTDEAGMMKSILFNHLEEDEEEESAENGEG